MEVYYGNHNSISEIIFTFFVNVDEFTIADVVEAIDHTFEGEWDLQRDNQFNPAVRQI